MTNHRALVASVLLPLTSSLLCLERLIATNFSPGQVLVFSMAFNSSIATNVLLTSVNSKAEWPVVISTDYQSADSDIPEPQHGYVLIVLPEEDHVESASRQIDILQSFGFSYNRRARFFVVVLQHNVADDLSLSHKILKELWELHRIVNAAVFINESGKVYTLMPYTSNECGGFDEVQLIHQCTEEASVGLQLPEKLPQDMRGCNLRVNVRIIGPYIAPISIDYDDIDDFEGIDLVYLKFAAEAMNISLKLNFAAKEYDDTFNRFMNDGDIYIGGAPLVAFVLPFVDVTIPHVFFNYMLFVPCSRPNPTSGNVLKVFSTSVWLILTAVLFVGAVLLCYFNKRDSFSRCLLDAWALFLSSSVHREPSRTKVRMFFLVFLFYCFAINTIFQSLFTSFMIDPGYGKQINSFEDLNERRIPFVYYEGFEDLEFFSETKILPNMKYKLECTEYTNCLQQVLRYGNGSLWEEKLILEYAAYSHGIYCDHCPILPVLKFNVPVSIYLTKGDPLLERFNYFIQKCLEVGLAQRYTSLLTAEKLLVNWSSQEDAGSYTVLGLSHFQTPFLFIVVGCSLSASIFLLELVLSHTLQKGA